MVLLLSTIERVCLGLGVGGQLGEVVKATRPLHQSLSKLTLLGETLDWNRVDMPYFTCRGDSTSLQGAQTDNPPPRICQEWFALDGRERWRIAFAKQQYRLSKTVQLCVCLGLIHWTRPWAEGGGWLLTSHRPREAKGPHF